MTGVPSSLTIGLISYLASSRAKTAANLTLGSFTAITLAYFFNCRREFDRKVKENKELGEIMNMIIKYRGTEMEEQLQKKYKEKMEEIDSKAKYV
jgi:hypothetical protein